MKIKLTTAVLMVSCLSCGPVTTEQEKAAADAFISAMVDSESAGVTVAVAKSNEILFSKGYGAANVEYGIPNTPETIFHVASLSKQFTAFAITLLADEGRISLDDDIRKYLPELHDFGKPITIKHLVYHTSGLRDQWNLLALAGWRLDDVITRNQVLRLISHQEDLNFRPGDEFLYCNTGYTLLGEIVSRVTGTSFPEWCDENIFTPLKMEHTLFYDDHEKIVKNRAYSYQDSPDGLKKSVLSYANAGAISLFTTAEDLTKWSDNFYTMKVGNEGVMKQMGTCGVLNKGDTLDYAFGQGSGIYKGLKTFAHGGADAGYRTFLLRFPEHKLSIAVLSNLGSFNPAKAAYGIAEIYLKHYVKEEAEKPEGGRTVAGTHQVREDLLNRYVGRYELNDELIISFSVENNKFIAEATGQPPSTMVAESDSVFRIDEIGARITFNTASDGAVHQFTLSQGGQTMVAKRIAPFDPASVDLAGYTGTYYSPELQTRYTLKLKGDTLIANHIRHEPAAMTAIGKDSFSTDVWFMGKINFTRNDKTEISGFNVSSGRVKHVRFVRMD